MDTATAIAHIWYKTPVLVHLPGKRTARGETPGVTVTVLASIDGSSRLVPAGGNGAPGDEVLAAATLKWAMNEVLPPPGSKVTVPDEYGLKGARLVLTSRRVKSGTGLTPDHVEVTIQ